MLTALCIFAFLTVVIGIVGLIGVCLDQGFLFWAFFGQDAIKACFVCLGILLQAILDANS